MDDLNRNKTKVGTIVPDEKPSFVGVGCALGGMLDDVILDGGQSPVIRNLLGSASQNTITEGVSFDQEPGIEQEVVTTKESDLPYAHSSAHHAKSMDSALWSELPEALQELVFAHLPWPQIYQARILSKGWNEKLMSCIGDSELKHACVRAQPKSFALLGTSNRGSFFVEVFNMTSSRWRTLKISPGYKSKRADERKIFGMSASDGWLVCLLTNVSYESEKMPCLVSVCNPLTRVFKQLPPLFGIVQPQIMMQMIMDQETKHYRVVVVGYCKDSKVGTLVKVYHSETGHWTQANGSSSGEVVYGLLYQLNAMTYNESGLCSYDFANVVVHVTDLPGIMDYEWVYKWVPVKDHLFRLPYVTQACVRLWTNCIEESQAMDCGASWLPLKEYPLSHHPRTALFDDRCCWMHLFACNDFLLLYEAFVTSKSEKFSHESLWLYEFSEKEWRELPMMSRIDCLFYYPQQLCELRFDSVP